MEAKDLMIGDWVEYLDKYHIITKINKIERSVGLWGKLIRDDIIVPTNTIEPIPLTPEILENVGFSYDENINKYILTDKDTYDNLIVLYKLANGFAMTTEGMTIGLQNVHELQHLFRLCGIEKEIELYDRIYK